MSTEKEKKKLRKHYAAMRKKFNANSGNAERQSLRIAKNIFSLPRIQEADLILVYYKIDNEVDTATLIDLITNSGRGVALPYCKDNGDLGIARILNPRYDLATGKYGVMEPTPDFRDNILPQQLDAIVCPGLAFDASGTRLGRGGGYYDRFLKHVKPDAFITGCAFDCQISDAPLPREDHDLVMHAVVTESRAFPLGVCPMIPVEEDEVVFDMREDGGRLI